MAVGREGDEVEGALCVLSMGVRDADVDALRKVAVEDRCQVCVGLLRIPLLISEIERDATGLD